MITTSSTGKKWRQRGLPASLLAAARPRQWSKNVLVFAAPAAAGVLFEPPRLGRALVAFVAFCLASSGTYYLNDVMDVEADRLHPRKRLRPIAAGEISVKSGVGIALVLLVASAVVAAATAAPAFVLAVIIYCLLTCSYSIWLKHVPVLDILVVAGGFIVRAVAGGLATGVPLSVWFLIVASFGALFIVVGKRHAELDQLGDGSRAHRAVLAAYTQDFTRHALAVASATASIAYCLWAFESMEGGGGLFYALSIVPFVALLMRYAMLVFAGQGGEPEDLVLRDRSLQCMGLALLALLGVAIGVA